MEVHLSVGDVESFGQLGKVLVDVDRLQAPTVGCQTFVQRDRVTLEDIDRVDTEVLAKISIQKKFKWRNPAKTTEDFCMDNTFAFFQFEMQGGIFHSCCSFTVI